MPRAFHWITIDTLTKDALDKLLTELPVRKAQEAKITCFCHNGNVHFNLTYRTKDLKNG